MNTNKIQKMGEIEITDTVTGEVKVSATYDANEIIDALKAGESIESIVQRLEK